MGLMRRGNNWKKHNGNRDIMRRKTGKAQGKKANQKVGESAKRGRVHYEKEE